jgi:AraC-like DNA-binding protein
MNSLELGLAGTLEPTGSIFAASDFRGTKTLRLIDSYLFVFVAQSDITVTAEKFVTSLFWGGRGATALRSAAGRRFSPQSGAEFYALKFKAAPQGARGAARPLTVPARGTAACPERLVDLLHRYMAEQRRRRSMRWALYNLLVLILYEFAFASGGSLEARPVVTGLETIASMVDAYIAAHCRETICTHNIALDLRYSPGYLERAYRRERGISVRSALHLRRIREARAAAPSA